MGGSVGTAQSGEGGRRAGQKDEQGSRRRRSTRGPRGGGAEPFMGHPRVPLWTETLCQGPRPGTTCSLAHCAPTTWQGQTRCRAALGSAPRERVCGGIPVVGFLRLLPVGSQNKSSHGTTALGRPLLGAALPGTHVLPSSRAPPLPCQDSGPEGTPDHKRLSAQMETSRRSPAGVPGCAEQWPLSRACPVPAHEGVAGGTPTFRRRPPKPPRGPAQPPRPESAGVAASSPMEGKAPCGRAPLSRAQPRAETAR